MRDCSMEFEPIAILGSSCLLEGVFSSSDLFEKTLKNDRLFKPASALSWGIDPEIFTKEGYFFNLPSITEGSVNEEEFNNKFFEEIKLLNLKKNKLLDPLYYWIIHTARSALENANCIKYIRHKKINAIFGNLSYPTNALCELSSAILLNDQRENFYHNLINPQMAAINRFMSGYPAHLLVEALNLKGEAFSLDAACASSLYAVKFACDQLHNDEAEIVIAGGVTATSGLFLHISSFALQALSKSGECLPFNKEACGIVPSRGAGFVVLKKLEKALQDHDSIISVIRGIGLSNDGNQGGLLSPSQQGQVTAMLQAYKQSDVDPKDICYVECHATGTVLGDTIEVKSLKEVFEKTSPNLMISALKSNVGHLFAASGAVAIIRCIESLRSSIIPPTRNATHLIDELKNSTFHLLREKQEWPLKKSSIKLAAVNAFGMGGNNAHIILEQWNSQFKLPPTKKIDKKSEEFAIVSVGVLLPGIKNTDEFKKALLEFKFNETWKKVENKDYSIDEIKLPLIGLRFPPNELSIAQPQQLAIIYTALQALAQVKTIALKKTAIIIGMQCDPGIARFDLQWKLPYLMQHHGISVDQQWIKLASNSICDNIQAGHVLGAMPNVVANRLNIQFDSVAPSFSVSDEELSGLTALNLAVQALQRREIDAAIVGAVDFNCNEVDTYIHKSLFNHEKYALGDAAITLIVKRLEDAIKDKDEILAIYDKEENNFSIHAEMSNHELDPLWGRAYSASGLLTIAAATVYCAEGFLPNKVEKKQPVKGMNIRVNIKSFSGKTGQCIIRQYIQ